MWVLDEPRPQALPSHDHLTFDPLKIVQKNTQFSMSQRLNDRTRGEPGDEATGCIRWRDFLPGIECTSIDFPPDLVQLVVCGTGS